MSFLNRSVVAVSLALVTSACGVDESLKPTVMLSTTEATLLKRNGAWSLTAPLTVKLPPTSAQWQLVAVVNQLSGPPFILDEDMKDIDPRATSFEVPLTTFSGDLKQGSELKLKLTVTAFAWNGGIEIEETSASAEYRFVMK